MEKLHWTTEKRKIKDLLPADYNPRQMTEAQAKELRKSLEKFDLVEIPAVNTDGIILAGHQRLHILGLMGRGDEEIDVRIPNRPLTELEAQEYNLRSNKNTGEWDMDKLFAMPEGLLEEVGFSNKEIQSLIDGHTDTKEDDYDVDKGLETPVRVEKGQIWQLGSHRLMCGDSTDKQDVERLMDGKRAGMFLSDPPYNVALGMNETPEEAKKRNRRTDGLVVQNDEMNDEDFNGFLFNVFTVADSVLDEGGVFYIWHADSEGYNFRSACKQVGWKVRQCLIWNKSSLIMGRQDYQWKHEPCLYGWKDGAAHLWNSDRTQTTVIDFQKPSNSKLHPTMKPIELMVYQIKNSSNIDQIILDLFGGSGSTLIACEQTDRVCYMMEIDPKYCTVILDRWEKLTGKKAEIVVS